MRTEAQKRAQAKYLREKVTSLRIDIYPKDKDITAEMVKIINAGHEKEKQEAQARLAAIRARAQQQPPAK